MPLVRCGRRWRKTSGTQSTPSTSRRSTPTRRRGDWPMRTEPPPTQLHASELLRMLRVMGCATWTVRSRTRQTGSATSLPSASVSGRARSGHRILQGNSTLPSVALPQLSKVSPMPMLPSGGRRRHWPTHSGSVRGSRGLLTRQLPTLRARRTGTTRCWATSRGASKRRRPAWPKPSRTLLRPMHASVNSQHAPAMRRLLLPTLRGTATSWVVCCRASGTDRNQRGSRGLTPSGRWRTTIGRLQSSRRHSLRTGSSVGHLTNRRRLWWSRRCACASSVRTWRRRRGPCVMRTPVSSKLLGVRHPTDRVPPLLLTGTLAGADRRTLPVGTIKDGIEGEGEGGGCGGRPRLALSFSPPSLPILDPPPPPP
eukprot:Sspe_Gene.8709::Locus_2944_Transcript_1_1_Confidence_1.000_Length_1593::g.8709::m.8709